MKKSTFKKAGVAVLSMAMLLSMGAMTATSAYAANTPIPTAAAGAGRTIVFPKGCQYDVYQIASATLSNGVYTYTVNSPFTDVLNANADTTKIVTTQSLIAGNSETLSLGQTQHTNQQVAIPAGTPLNDIVSFSSQAEALATTLKLKTEGNHELNAVKSTVDATSASQTVDTLPDGYYLVVPNANSEPILVFLNNEFPEREIAGLKIADVTVDKTIEAVDGRTKDADYNAANIDALGTTAQAEAGSIIDFKIATEFPKYNSESVKAQSTDITDFTIVDTPDSTLTLYGTTVNGTDHDITSGITVTVIDGEGNTSTPRKGTKAQVEGDNRATTQYDYYVVMTDEQAAGAKNPLNGEGTEAKAQGFKIVFADPYVISNGGKTVEITYKAKLAAHDNAADPKIPNLNAVSNDNHVELTYSNNYDTGVGTYELGEVPDPTEDVTEKDDVYVFTTKFVVDKRDGNLQPLAGAEFKLYKQQTAMDGGQFVMLNSNGEIAKDFSGEWHDEDGNVTSDIDKAVTTSNPSEGRKVPFDAMSAGATENDTYAAATIAQYQNKAWLEVKEPVVKSTTAVTEGGETTNIENMYTYNGLEEGTYKLVETATPGPDYKKADDQTIVIGNTVDSQTGRYTGVFTFTNNGTALSWTAYDSQTPDATVKDTITIQNYKGQTLPGTGGIGTYLFTFGGAAVILMAGAMFVMYMKKREVEE